MSEVEELRRQVAELKQKLAEMSDGAVIVGRAKVDRSAARADVWRLAYHSELNDSWENRVINERWVNLAQSKDRAMVIDEIPKVISNMQKLYDTLKGEEQ